MSRGTPRLTWQTLEPNRRFLCAASDTCGARTPVSPAWTDEGVAVHCGIPSVYVMETGREMLFVFAVPSLGSRCWTDLILEVPRLVSGARQGPSVNGDAASLRRADRQPSGDFGKHTFPLTKTLQPRRSHISGKICTSSCSNKHLAVCGGRDAAFFSTLQSAESEVLRNRTCAPP